jgi:putative addiction module component (TIGR02574 family)
VEDKVTDLANSLFKEVLQLSPSDRAELIERLFTSFDSVLDEKIDAKWREEVEERVAAFDAGKISSDSADNVLKRLLQR